MTVEKKTITDKIKELEQDIEWFYSDDFNLDEAMTKYESAIKKSKAKRLYFCNVMTQPGETDYFSVEDHVEAIEKHSFKGIIPKVIVSKNEASEELIKKYRDKGAYRVKIDQANHDYEIEIEDLLDHNVDLIRHDSLKIRDFVIELLKESD